MCRVPSAQEEALAPRRLPEDRAPRRSYAAGSLAPGSGRAATVCAPPGWGVGLEEESSVRKGRRSSDTRLSGARPRSLPVGPAARQMPGGRRGGVSVRGREGRSCPVLLCPAAAGSPRLRGPRRGCPGLNSEADRQGLPGLVSDNVRGGAHVVLSCLCRVCFTSRGDTAATLVNRRCRAVEVGGTVPWAWGCGGRPAGSWGAPGLRSRLPGSTVGV